MHQLIGKTIKKIELGEVDLYNDGERVSEVYKITCTDDSVLFLIAEGGDTSFYATISASESLADLGNIEPDVSVWLEELKDIEE